MKKGRICFHTRHLFALTARRISVATHTALLQLLPAFFSCTSSLAPEPFDEPSHVYIQWTKSQAPAAINLFFFDTLGIRRLDAYQQIVTPENDSPVYGLSCTGPKYLVAFSGKSGEKESWADICTLNQLKKRSFRLEQESALSPLLFGQVALPDGASRLASLELKPLLCSIRLKSVSCDFSGRPYNDDAFHLHKLFLTYAGSEYRPLEEGDGQAVSWINPGSLDSLEVMNLPNPEMILQEGPGAAGPTRIYPDQTFYCYPGAPTRLVLEASVGSITCYYPVPLTLERGCCTELDLTILRMGSPDPDIPTVSGAYSLETRTIPWEEYQAYSVVY